MSAFRGVESETIRARRMVARRHRAISVAGAGNPVAGNLCTMRAHRLFFAHGGPVPHQL